MGGGRGGKREGRGGGRGGIMDSKTYRSLCMAPCYAGGRIGNEDCIWIVPVLQ